MRVLAFCKEDVAPATEILAASPEASSWSKESLLSLVASGFQGWTAEMDCQVAGFLIGRVVLGEFEILNLAVVPALRRRGIGRALVKSATDFAGQQGATRAFLEVRASNAAAIGIYVVQGFRECGRRKHYYQHPPEDALMFSRAIENSET